MSPDIEDLLRSELRDAASGAPHHLGVDDHDVITRGRRVVVRRRILTAAGVAAATLAIAGTIGLLAPRTSNDALPALPTPTISATPDPTPTITSTSIPSATPSTTPTVTPSATPTAKVPSTPTALATTTSTNTARPSSTPSSSPTRTVESTPTSTPSARPSSTPSPSTVNALPWSKTVTVAGKTYRGRLVAQGGSPETFNLELEADGKVVWLAESFYEHSSWNKVDSSDRRLFYLTTTKGALDLVSIDGKPISNEDIGEFVVPIPAGAYRSIGISIFWAPQPVTETTKYGPKGWVVEFTDGLWDFEE